MIKLGQDTVELLDKVAQLKGELYNTLVEVSDKISRDTNGIFSCCTNIVSTATQLFVENDRDTEALSLILEADKPTVAWIDEECNSSCYSFDCSNHSFIAIVDCITEQKQEVQQDGSDD